MSSKSNSSNSNSNSKFPARATHGVRSFGEGLYPRGEEGEQMRDQNRLVSLMPCLVDACTNSINCSIHKFQAPVAISCLSFIACCLLFCVFVYLLGGGVGRLDKS